MAKRTIKTNDKLVSSSGTQVQAGYFFEDRKTTFDDYMKWPQQADEMERSDAHVFKVLRSVRLPIASAQWMIEVDSDDQRGEEKKQYIEDVFWNRIDQKNFIKQCLTYIKYGFAVFEKVFAIEDVPGWGKTAVLEHCSIISAKTIETFDFDQRTSELRGVRQLGYGDLGRDVFVPAYKLMILTFGKEGDDLRGIPPLRPCYRDYRHKDETLTAIRRGNINASRGVPYVIMPEARDSDQQLADSIKAVFDAYAKDKTSGFYLPHGCEIATLKLEYDAQKLLDSVRYLDRQISGAFGCAFLEIGQSGTSGGYAQSTSESDFFLSGLEEVANQIAETINDHIIKPLVEWRFGRDDYCPSLVVRGINDTDPEARAETLKKLRDAGLISDETAVKEQIHREFKLPEYREEDEEGEPEEVPSPDDEEDKEVIQNSAAFIFAQNKAEKPVAHIEKSAKEMAAMMRRQLGRMSFAYIDAYATDVRGMTAAELPEKDAYTQLLTESALDNAREAKAIALNELESVFDASFLSDAELGAIYASVSILVAAQEQRIKQDATLSVISSIGRGMSLEATKKAANKAVMDYVTSSAIDLEATNHTSALENRARNEVFQRPETLARIEYFRFVNPDPKSAICINLNGKVFTKEEYLDTPYLPPLHHNCKSVIVPIGKNEKVVADGLKPTGTQEQIAKAEKRIKFDAACPSTT